MAKTLDATESAATLDAGAPSTLDAATFEGNCPNCGVVFRLSMLPKNAPIENEKKDRSHIGKKLDRAIAIAQILEQEPALTSTELAKRAGGSRNDTLRLIAHMRGKFCKHCGGTEFTSEGDCPKCIATMQSTMQATNERLERERVAGAIHTNQ